MGQASVIKILRPIAAPSSNQLDQTGTVTLDISSVVYGLGFFGLSSTTQAPVGYFLFFCVEVLGLAVTLVAFIITGTGLSSLKVCRETTTATLVDGSLA